MGLRAGPVPDGLDLAVGVEAIDYSDVTTRTLQKVTLLPDAATRLAKTLIHPAGCTVRLPILTADRSTKPKKCADSPPGRLWDRPSVMPAKSDINVNRVPHATGLEMRRLLVQK